MRILVTLQRASAADPKTRWFDYPYTLYGTAMVLSKRIAAYLHKSVGVKSLQPLHHLRQIQQRPLTCPLPFYECDCPLCCKVGSFAGQV